MDWIVGNVSFGRSFTVHILAIVSLLSYYIAATCTGPNTRLSVDLSKGIMATPIYRTLSILSQTRADSVNMDPAGVILGLWLHW